METNVYIQIKKHKLCICLIRTAELPISYNLNIFLFRIIFRNAFLFVLGGSVFMYTRILKCPLSCCNCMLLIFGNHTHTERVFSSEVTQ